MLKFQSFSELKIAPSNLDFFVSLKNDHKKKNKSFDFQPC